MAPSLALFLWLVPSDCTIVFRPRPESGTSLALWVPVIWMFILGSRLPSQWLGGGMGQSAQALVEGNPLDRIIDLILIFLAIGILTSRSFKWRGLFSRNLALMAFLSFALISTFWSDFPFVAFKRWFRDLGGYIVILVVLSDPRPEAAIRVVLRRLGYLLVPLSIVLDKYYPQLSKAYANGLGSGTTRRDNKQEYARSRLSCQWSIFLLGYSDALARAKATTNTKILALNATFLGIPFGYCKLHKARPLAFACCLGAW